MVSEGADLSEPPPDVPCAPVASGSDVDDVIDVALAPVPRHHEARDRHGSVEGPGLRNTRLVCNNHEQLNTDLRIILISWNGGPRVPELSNAIKMTFHRILLPDSELDFGLCSCNFMVSWSFRRSR